MTKKSETILFTVIMAIGMGFFMSLFFTVIYTGIDDGFLFRWLNSFLLGTLVAFPSSIIMTPIARKTVEHISKKRLKHNA